MLSPWDERYSADEYIYGTEPNEFLRRCLNDINAKGKILFPAEGEGRNAVYAAEIGWETYAFDQSEIAKQKAEKLASSKNVTINYEFANFENYIFPEVFFDVVALIYVHLPSSEKKILITKTLGALKKGAYLIMEVFSKDQLSYNSGGPKNLDMLYSVEELQECLTGTENILIKKEIIQLCEGTLHQGTASVIRVIARKK